MILGKNCSADFVRKQKPLAVISDIKLPIYSYASLKVHTLNFN